MPEVAPLNVCFVAGTLEHGGAERQLFHMLQALCQCGVGVRLLCLDRGKFWEEPIRSLGVSVTWVGQHPSRLARLLRVLRELRVDPPDLVQSQHFFANAYVALSARLLGIGGIGAIRNEGAAEVQKNGPLGGRLNLRLPRLLAANSRIGMWQAIEFGVSPARLYFLPNVVDTQHFKPAEGTVKRPLTLLAVGRIVKEKRLDRFITALGRLRTELRLDVRGWIAGPVQDRHHLQELEALAAGLGLLPAHLRFLGGVANMRPLYQQADICVLTSDFEGTPNALLEAMASGLPAMATNVGGVPDIVRHGRTGFIVDRQDKEGLVLALAELVKDCPGRREMGRRAREFVQAEHSVERLPAYLAKLYALALPARCHGQLKRLGDKPALRLESAVQLRRAQA
ncbi:MAG TPA: glycosyltransferase family 4 protein [Verrucomicrobiae bacterium]|nr:glycosyltransferase family 4 protein [Verrucomicrobiae bacterium]